MNQEGLTTVGVSRELGGLRTPIWEQDQSIMSWTGGYCISSAHSIAKFLFNLLAPFPKNPIISPESVKVMKTVSEMNAKSYYNYGFGLMNGQIGGTERHPPTSDIGKFAGHDGITYGFSSNNGYFPALNASLSVIVSQDTDFFFSRNYVMCPVLEIIANYKGMGIIDLDC
jgi:hypothetical protein